MNTNNYLVINMLGNKRSGGNFYSNLHKIITLKKAESNVYYINNQPTSAIEVVF